MTKVQSKRLVESGVPVGTATFQVGFWNVSTLLCILQDLRLGLEECIVADGRIVLDGVPPGFQ